MSEIPSSDIAKGKITKRHARASIAAGLLTLGGFGAGATAIQMENEAASTGILLAVGAGIPAAIVLENRRTEKYCEKVVKQFGQENGIYSSGIIAKTITIEDGDLVETSTLDENTITVRTDGVGSATLAGVGSVLSGSLAGALSEGAVLGSAEGPVQVMTGIIGFVAGLGVASTAIDNLESAEGFRRRIDNIENTGSGITLA